MVQEMDPAGRTQAELAARRTAWLIRPGASVLAPHSMTDGYLLKLLRQRGCRIVTIDSAEHSQEDANTWRADVLVVSDALLLSDTPNQDLTHAGTLLAPDGYVVATLPTLPDGAPRLNFLASLIADGLRKAEIERNPSLATIAAAFFEECGFAVAQFERVELTDSLGHPTPSALALEERAAFSRAVQDTAASHLVVLGFPASSTMTAQRAKRRPLLDSYDAARHEMQAATAAAIYLEARYRKHLDERDSLIATLRHRIDELKESSQRLSSARERELAIHQLLVAALNSDIRHLAHVADRFEQSWSWRLTAPLRRRGSLSQWRQ